MRSARQRTATGPRMTPEALLDQFAPGVRELANEVRAILMRAVPTFTQRALPGWRAIAFRDPQAGHVCALFPLEDGVKLYLEHGARLEDPDGMMEGDVLQTRYVTFRTVRGIRRRALAGLVQRAVAEQSVSRARSRR